MTPEQLVAWLRDEDDGMKTPCLEAADLIESLSSKLDAIRSVIYDEFSKGKASSLVALGRIEKIVREPK